MVLGMDVGSWLLDWKMLCPSAMRVLRLFDGTKGFRLSECQSQCI